MVELLNELAALLHDFLSHKIGAFRGSLRIHHFPVDGVPTAITGLVNRDRNLARQRLPQQEVEYFRFILGYVAYIIG